MLTQLALKKQQVLDIYDALINGHGHPDPPHDLSTVDLMHDSGQVNGLVGLTCVETSIKEH